MTDREIVERSVKGAVARLLSMPPEEWGPWMVGVFEGLETHVAQEGYEEAFAIALAQVQHYLERRLLDRLSNNG